MHINNMGRCTSGDWY